MLDVISENWSFFSALAGAFFGGGCAWGAVRGDIKALKKEVLDEREARAGMEARLKVIERATVTREECCSYQGKCAVQICRRLDEICDALKEGHDNTLENARRIGTVEGKIDLLIAKSSVLQGERDHRP